MAGHLYVGRPASIFPDAAGRADLLAQAAPEAGILLLEVANSLVYLALGGGRSAS